MTRRPAGGGPRAEPTLVLTVPPPRRPWVVRGVIAGCAVVIAVLWTLLLTGALDGTWGEGAWVGTGSVLVASLGYSAWVVRRGRVVVDGDELVVRPGLVLAQRCSIRDVVAVNTGTSHVRSVTVVLSGGRRFPLVPLADADVQRLVEVLREVEEHRGSRGHPRTVGAAGIRANGMGADPHGADEQSGAEGQSSAGRPERRGLSRQAGRGAAGSAGAVRAPGAARWPDPPRASP